MSTFTIVSRPYYDSQCQQYMNVLCIEGVPVGPILKRARRLAPSRQIGYDYNIASPCRCWTVISSSHCNCRNVNKVNFLTGDDVTYLMQWFLKHGYIIDTKLTKMLATSEVQQPLSKIVFTVTFPFPECEPNHWCEFKRPNVA